MISVTSYHCSTVLHTLQTPGQTLKIIDTGFSIDVPKSLKLSVMDLLVKSTLKTHLTCHQLPSAVVSVSWQPRVLLAMNCSDTGPVLFSILSLIYVSTSIQQDNRDSGASASHVLSHLSIAHMASAPIIQPHIYNSWRSSGFALTALPAPIKECGGIKLFGANISSCSELQWPGPVFIHHMGEARSAMILPKYF